MRYDLQAITLPFPASLMATAQSPLNLPPTYARALNNMLLAPDGSGTKRNGVVPEVALPAGEGALGIFSFTHNGSVQLLVWSDAGKIYRQNGAAWVLLKSGLATACAPVGVVFAGRLVLANGLDALMQYDGVAISTVEMLVKDAGANLTYISPTQFSIASQAELYPAGRSVKVKVNGADVMATVAGAVQAGATTTVTLTAAVLATPLTEVWFTVQPPKFAGLAVAHNRLWGFGAGGFGPNLGTAPDAMRVYYTHSVNSVNGWADPATGLIPSLNLADKAAVADELLAMRVVDGMTVFLCRQHLQLYEGTTPGVVGGLTPDFAWLKSIPVGLAHPCAVQALPNDLLLLTPLGARTLSRTLSTEQLDLADVGRALDPTVLEAMQSAMLSAEAYRTVQAFGCAAQQWFGFGFAGQSLIWQLTPSGGGWSVFDGVFAGLTAAHTAPNGVLYLAKGNQIYRYAPEVWADAGEPFTARWWAPWVAPANGARWANKYIEVLLVPQAEQSLTLKRYSHLDEGNPRLMAMQVTGQADYWDTAQWDSSYFDNTATNPNTVRDHTVAERLSFALESTNPHPLRVLGLKIYGLAER